MYKGTYQSATPLGILVVTLLLMVGTRAWLPGVDEPLPGRPSDVPPYNGPEFYSGEAKRAVARELAAGRLTLLDAAALIRDIDRNSPHFQWDEFRRAYPLATDEERHCRETLEWVRTVLPDDDQTTKLVRNLEDEIAQRVCAGQLQFPELAKP